MAIFPEPSIWLEHIQWENKFSPHMLHSNSQSQLFSNFGSFQAKSNVLDEDFDYNSFINTISSQLSSDVFQDIMKIVYTDKIYKSLQLKQNCTMHVEKKKSNLRRTKSFIYEQNCNLLEEKEEFFDIDQLNFCDSDESCGYYDEKNHSFNSLS